MNTLKIAKFELKKIFHEKTFIVMVLFQLLLVLGSNFLGIGFLLFSQMQDPEFKIRGEITRAGILTNNKEFFEKAAEKSPVKAIFYSDKKDLLNDFKTGKIDAIISGNIETGKQNSIEVVMPENSPIKGLTSISLKQFFVSLQEIIRKKNSSQNNFEIPFPETVYREKGKPDTKEVFYFFTVPVLLILPIIVASTLAMESLSNEIEQKKIYNITRLPIKEKEIVLGKLLAQSIAALSQSLFWTAFISIFYVALPGIVWLTVLTVILSFLLVSISITLTLILKKERSSQTAFYLSFAALFWVLFNSDFKGFELNPLKLAGLLSVKSVYSYIPSLSVYAGLAIVFVLLMLYFSKELKKI